MRAADRRGPPCDPGAWHLETPDAHRAVGAVLWPPQTLATPDASEPRTQLARRRSTTLGTTARAWSISSSVVV
jgi:hypothetical protein